MKTLIAIIAVALIGCGGGSSDTKEEVKEDPIKEEKPVERSNLGQNINSLGYYDNDTMFGSLKIVGEKVLFPIRNGELVNEPIQQRYSDVFDTIFRGEFVEAGFYGVSEDTKTLYQHFTLIDSLITFKYIDDIDEKCILVQNNENMYAFCSY